MEFRPSLRVELPWLRHHHVERSTQVRDLVEVKCIPFCVPCRCFALHNANPITHAKERLFNLDLIFVS